jgi:ribonuclease HI
MTDKTHPQLPNELKLLQQNLNKSNEAQSALLHDTHNAHILLLQEPYINKSGNTTIGTSGWTSIYPTRCNERDTKIRSVILVRSDMNTDSYEPLDIPHSDITGISLKCEFGLLRIFNLYNDIWDNTSLLMVKQYLRQNPRQTTPQHPVMDIILGDMNRHHPLWDEARNEHLFTARALRMAEPLITLLTKFDMTMALPHGIPTLEAFGSTKNLTRPDNVFCSTEHVDRFIVCEARPADRPPRTDHFPIMSVLDVHPAITATEPRPDFRKADWKKLKETLNQHLSILSPPQDILTKASFDQRLELINQVIAYAVSEHVPISKPCPRSKRWWTPELKQERKEVAKLGRRAWKNAWMGDDTAKKAHTRARRAYGTSIKLQKTKHWYDWISNMSSSSTEIWKAAQFVSGDASDGCRSRVPTLIVKDDNGTPCRITSNAEKAEAFRNTFFPPPAAVSPPTPSSAASSRLEFPSSSTTSNIYSPPSVAKPRTYKPAWEFSLPTDAQIMRVFKKLAPGKATSPGTPSNDLLRNCADLLAPFIGPLYRATFSINYYPPAWARTETMVTRKPGKTDYQQPGSFRPLAKSDGWGRGLNAVISEEVQYECERLGILPSSHYGSRPGRSAMDAVMELVSIVTTAWRQGKVATALFLDVKGAFPSVDISQLMAEMYRRGIPEQYVQWLETRMAGRTTVLAFDDHRSKVFKILGGLDQGDPWSALLYILYNSALLELVQSSKGESSIGYVDDVTYIAVAKNFEQTHKKIESILSRNEGALEWSDEHNCEFSIPKFQAVDFTRRTRPKAAATVSVDRTAQATQKTLDPGAENDIVNPQTKITSFFAKTTNQLPRTAAPPSEGRTEVSTDASTRQLRITTYFNPLPITTHPPLSPPSSPPNAIPPDTAKTRKCARETVHGGPIRIREHLVFPSTSAKLLGVHLDAQLRWKEQLSVCLAKGEQWLRQFRRLTQSTRGLSGRSVARLWDAIAVPRIYYGAELFLTPHTSKKGSRGGRVREISQHTITKLASIQRRAAILITGGMYSSSGDSLVFHAGLQPTRFLIQSIRHRAATRLGTLPEQHPLHLIVKRILNERRTQTFRSPIHDLISDFKIQQRNMETIRTIRYSPHWEFQAECRIVGAKKAMEEEKEDTAELKIFSDGSGMDGMVGASAVLFKGGSERRSRRFKLGKDTLHEVYDGEGVGLLCAFNLARIESSFSRTSLRSLSIYVDNEAAIRALELRKPAPSHYIWDAIQQEFDALRVEQPGVKVVVRWIPAHKDVLGNERADQEAKRATSGDVERPDHTFPSLLQHSLPHNRNSLRKIFKQQQTRKYELEWSTSPRYKRLAAIDTSLSPRPYQKLVADLPKIHTTILFQLRTGYIILNDYLHRISKADSPDCDRCTHRETVIHYILHCPRYTRHRRQLQATVGFANMNVKTLLSTRKHLPALMQYVADTKRLQSSFPDIPVLELYDDEDES